MKIKPSAVFLPVHQKLPTKGEFPVRGQLILYNIGGPDAKNYRLYVYSGSAWRLVTQSGG